MDLDIPGSPPSTLLHWMQLGLQPTTKTMAMNTTLGGQKIFMLQGGAGASTPATYISPNPPARVPVSHRYTELLVDTSAASMADLQALTAAAATRQGFEASTVLQKANLANKVVAGNSFNVTNRGRATTSITVTGSAAAAGTSGKNEGSAKSSPGLGLSVLSALLVLGLGAFGL